MNDLNQPMQQAHDDAAATQVSLRTQRRVRRNLTERIEPNQSAHDVGADDYDGGLDDDPVSTIPAQLTSMAMVPAQTAVPALPHTAITVSPLDLPAEQFRSGLDRRKTNRQLLMEWLRSALVDGVDYGRVHIAGKDKCDLARQGRVKECTNEWHWSKYSLFKPGAEKITGMLGMTVHYPSLPDIEAALLKGTEIKTIVMRCELHDAAGHVVAEGVGARNLVQDYGDINKSLKMAEKSAHIDATLRLAGLSEVFTQDVEDNILGTDMPDAPPTARAKPTAAETKTRTPRKANGTSVPPAPPPPPANPALVSAEDVKAIRAKIAEHSLSENKILIWIYKNTQGKVTRLEQLTQEQYVKLLRKIDEWSVQGSAPDQKAA